MVTRESQHKSNLVDRKVDGFFVNVFGLVAEDGMRLASRHARLL